MGPGERAGGQQADQGVEVRQELCWSRRRLGLESPLHLDSVTGGTGVSQETGADLRGSFFPPQNFMRNCDDHDAVSQYRLHSDFR